jgi:hypothetical protein
MRPIYWGLILFFAGICSSVILGLVADLQNFVENPVPPDALSMGYEVSQIPMPLYYIALIYIARFAMLFSFPLAAIIAIHRFPKSESK